MKKFYGLIGIVILIVYMALLLVATTYIVGRAFSKQQAVKAETITCLDERAEQVERCNLDLLNVIKSLSHENTLMCERDEKTFQVVREFEEENIRLKCSLADAVKKLTDQQEEINSLIDQNYDLKYKVGVLEKDLDAVNTPSPPHIQTLRSNNPLSKRL